MCFNVESPSVKIKSWTVSRIVKQNIIFLFLMKILTVKIKMSTCLSLDHSQYVGDFGWVFSGCKWHGASWKTQAHEMLSYCQKRYEKKHLFLKGQWQNKHLYMFTLHELYLHRFHPSSISSLLLFIFSGFSRHLSKSWPEGPESAGKDV